MKTPVVLIVAAPVDVHARACAWVLQKYGCEVLWFDTSSVGSPDSWWSFRLKDGHVECSMGGRTVVVDAVWDRRRYPKDEDARIHEADRAFVARESRIYDEFLLEILGSGGARWIDPYLTVRRAENKLAQLVGAKEAGLVVPDTLVTRQPSEVEEFIALHSGAVVKPFSGHLWIVDGKPKFEAIASRLQADTTIADAAVQACPAMYQQAVERVADIRAVVIGDKVFATRYVFTGAESQHFDSRVNLRDDSRTQAKAVTLPEAVQAGLLALVRRFGLTYASADFAEAMDGSLYFLDLNPQGQFLFNEGWVPEYRLLDQMARHIVGSLSKNWPSLELTLADYEDSEDNARLVEERNQAMGNAVQPKGYYAEEKTVA